MKTQHRSRLPLGPLNRPPGRRGFAMCNFVSSMPLASGNFIGDAHLDATSFRYSRTSRKMFPIILALYEWEKQGTGLRKSRFNILKKPEKIFLKARFYVHDESSKFLLLYILWTRVSWNIAKPVSMNTGTKLRCPEEPPWRTESTPRPAAWLHGHK